MALKRIQDLAPAAALDGSELVELEQGGASVQCTTQDIADLAGGGGGGGIPDAPSDGNIYGRKNAAWEQLADLTAPIVELAYVGQLAVSEVNPLRVSSYDVDRQANLLPDGRTKVVLLTGLSDQPLFKTNCTTTQDLARYKTGGESVRVTTAGAVTCTVFADPVFPSPSPDPFLFPPASLVRALVWVDDPAKVTQIDVSLLSSAPATWSRARTRLQRGWNIITFSSAAGNLNGWGSLNRVTVTAVVTAATSFNIDSVWVECPPKAQVLFIEDRGYKTFVDNGLPSLRARNIPVTWALDPLKLGDSPGTKNEAITEAQVATFYAAGDDMSIHAYTGGVTSNLTAAQIREDSLQSLKWLHDRGYVRGREWRAAWTQNLATNAAAAQPYFAAYATPIGSAAQETWPFLNKWNVARIQLHSRTTAYMDSLFANLQATHGLLVCYTHGIHPDGGTDMTQDQWDYFISKLDEGMSGGWLECVTLSQLIARSGGVVL